ncbi:hypothetical protein D3C80_1075330 [compost metagenome]
MQADHLLRPLRIGGNLANRQRRGIGGENGMRCGVLFNLGHHFLLQGQILKHRLHHDIHALKAGVIGRTGDQHHLFLPFRRAHAFTAYPLAEHVPTVF